MRDEQVQRAVRFLQTPSVQPIPLSEKLRFMEEKGLTSEEIAKALKLFDESNAKKSRMMIASVTGMKAGTMLQDRVGVIVGGLSELGYLVAIRLSVEGSKIVALDFENEETKAIAMKQDQWKCMMGDIMDYDYIDASYTTIAEEFGRVDYIVNCISSKSFIDKDIIAMEFSIWKQMISKSTANSVFLNMKRGLQQMLTQEDSGTRGRIVNVSYAREKDAHQSCMGFPIERSVVSNLTQSVAREYGSQRILCNALDAGVIDETSEKQVHDILSMILFLVSDQAEFMSGISFPVLQPSRQI